MGEKYDPLGLYQDAGRKYDPLGLFGTPKDTPEPPKRGFADVIKDVGVSFAGGANSLLETGGNLAGLAGVADMDNWASRQGKSGREYWDAEKSAALKADEAGRRAAIDSADGQWSKAGTAFWETIKNPALLSSFAAEQIPMFLPIGLAGRAGQVASLATGAAGKTASVAGKIAGKVGTEGAAARLAQKGLAGLGTAKKAAGAIGTSIGIGAGAGLQGSDVGGGAYDELMKMPDALWDQNADYQALRATIGDDQARHEISLGLARQAATEGGVASVLTNLLPFARTFERATAGASTKLKGNILARGAKGFAGESIQEASEEGLGKVASNRAAQEIDASRGLEEGVGEAAGMGAVGGGVMGGAMGMVSKEAPSSIEAQPPGTQPPPSTPDNIPLNAVPADQVFGTTDTQDDQLRGAEDLADAITEEEVKAATSEATAANAAIEAQKSPGTVLSNAAGAAQQVANNQAVTEVEQGIRTRQVQGWSDERLAAFITGASINQNRAPVQEFMLGMALAEQQERAKKPASMSILDGVLNGTTVRPTYPPLDTRSATGASNNAAGSDANGVLQHDAATGTGGLGMPGAAVEDDGAGGIEQNGSDQPRHVGHATNIILPDQTALPVQWEVVDADSVKASLKAGVEQPRDRESRAVSDVQINTIANNLNYDLVSRDTGVMDFGSSTLNHEGKIVGGNGRFEAISRAYDQGTAAEYRARLEADAATKGIDPASFAGMKKPVLVRRITKPFDTRTLAVASNAGGSLQYSALEQAKIDGERMIDLGDIEVNDAGDVVMSGSNMANVRRALTGYNAAELGSMTDKDGMLSQEGIRRIKNALLYKAYGNSSVLSRLVESADPDLKSVMGALVRSAGSVAGVRADMKDGNKPASADIVQDLLGAVEVLAKIKADGSSVEQYLAQQGVFGNSYRKEMEVILSFLNDNIRSQKRMAEFIRSYYDGIANEDHLTGSMFNAEPVTNKERLSHAAKETTRNTPEPERSAGEIHPQDGQQPQGAQSDAGGGGEGQQDTGLTSYTQAEIAQREAAQAAQERAQRAEEEDARAEQAAKDQAEIRALAMKSLKGNGLAQAEIVAVQAMLDEAIAEQKAISDLIAEEMGIEVSAKEEAKPELSAKAKAQADMDAARAEAGALLRAYGLTVNVIPEADKPKWMPVLVKMFDAAFRLGFYELKDAANHVREQLKTLNKQIAKFIPKSWMDQAAKEAAAKMPDGFFDNQGLFGQDAQPAQKLNPVEIDTKLTGKAAEIQTRFRDWVWNNLDEAIAQYQKANGNVLNTDEARKLSPDYNATPESRSLYSAAVHETASWLIKKIYRRELRKPTPDGIKKKVVFTAGGTGAGKSSSIKEIAELQHIVNTAQIVYDTNMNGIESSELKIKQALEKGFDVAVLYVYRDPQDALHGSLKRAMNKDSESYGRTVPISKHIDTHVGASETMHTLSGKYQGNENVAFLGIDNTGGKGASKQVTLANLPRLAYTLIDLEAYHELVRKEHREKRISDAVLEGTLGKPAYGSDDGRGARRLPQIGGALRPAGISEDDAGRFQGVRSGDDGRDQQPATPGGLNEHREDHTGGTQGKSPGAVATTDAERGSPAVRDGSGRGNIGSTGDADNGNSQQERPASGTENRPDEGGGNNEYGGQSGNGNSPARNAAIPAGRDIPLKSGRNYSFGDTDLTYAGSWQTKARQNVEAIELLKKLEGRQATRDEQAILAKFIGWGSSEIANSIFGDKLEKQLETLANYDEAIANLGSKPYLTNANYREYRPAFDVLRAKNPALNWYAAGNITKAMLDAAKPDVSARKWGDLRDRLKRVMTQEEWDAASRSTQYAHYTSKPVVKALLGAVSKMGFKGGTVLEPGAGIGVFPGLMSAEMGANSVYTGIEFDPITGGILKQLFPDERILVESFIDSRLPENFYDIAFGNPPFGAFKVLADPKYVKHAFALHDYFFAKSLDSVKPGGLLVFVTSRYTMDKKGDKARAYMAARADLVGAIRLPQTAFQKNAGTEVVTDILFLRKKVIGESFDGQAWAGLENVKTEKGLVPVNQYFASHPEMVMGTHSQKVSMYGKDEYTVLPNGGDIEAQIAAAVENLPADVFVEGRGSAAEAAKIREMDFDPKAKKEGSFYVTDAGVLMQREGGVGVRAEEKHQKNAAVLKDYIALRDAVKQSQLDQLNDGDWEASLKSLQKAYAGFVKKNGQLFQHTSYMQKIKVDELDEDGVPTGNKVDDEEVRYRFPLISRISSDPEYTLVSALEELNDDTGEITPTKWLTQRTLGKPAVAEIKTPSDALLATLNDTGAVDIAMIADRIGLSQQETIDALGTLIYEDPAQGWVMGDEYLSGNVKDKLAVAEESVKSDKRYARNVEALKAVQPTPKASGDIAPQIGMNWIPGAVYELFLYELTGVKAKIEYSERTHGWLMTTISGEKSLRATVDWGVGDKAHAAWLMEKALTGAQISLDKGVPDGKGGLKKVFDPDRTEAANHKRSQMRNEFSGWLFQDAGRTTELVQLYNDKFNTTVQRKFDGNHLTLPGTSKLFNIFDHVKRGAWRVIQTGNTYLAHAVGSGKTFEMVISAMEQKRLGKIKKPMMIVPGHMLQQFASEWQQLYPTARLMVADEKDFHTDNRRRFVSRVAMSDLDGVIMTHSSFGILDLDPAFKQKMIQQELDVLRATYEEAGGDLEDIGDKKKRKDPKIKRIEAQIEKLEQQLAQAMSSEGKDKNVRFDEMGVDMLYVDEAHMFRKLSFATARQMKGIDPSGSQMAWDLYMKTRWLAEKNPTRNLVMASGTPITNTTAELYTVQRFMAPKVLEEKWLTAFDSWASQFGEEATAIESTSSGKYEPVTRFSRFINVGEMTQMFRDFADVLSEDHLAALLGDKRPRLAGGSRKSVITPKTEQYKRFQVEDLVPRIEASKKWRPSFEQPYNPDPIIAINIDARLAAIDMRFMQPSLPNDPDSKLNHVIDGVIRAYNESKDNAYRGKSTKDKDGKEVLSDFEAIKGSTHMMFYETGFGKMAAQNRGFNARAWMEKRLRDAGIPPNHLAFMEDYKKSASKLKLFKDVNSGKIRVLVGSRAAMGTGVNAQQRLLTLHHLDAPQVPAVLEQSEGRILRQGNKNPEVQIYAYAMFGSFDENQWGTLARKKFFIEQALSGDPNIRSIEDVGEVNQMEMAAGLIAENPYVMQLAGARAEVEKLTRLYRSHEEQRARTGEDYAHAERAIDFNTLHLPATEKVAGKVTDLSGDKFTAKAEGKSFNTRKEWGAALLSRFKELSDKLDTKESKVGEISGFDVIYSGTRLAGEYSAHMVLKTPLQTILAHDALTDPVGLSIRATNALVDLSRKPAEMQRIIKEAQTKREAMVTRLNAPFPLAEQLANKVKEAAELEKQVQDYGKKDDPAKADEAVLATPDDAPLASVAKKVVGMSVARVARATAKLRASWRGLRLVHVVKSVNDIPGGLFQRAMRAGTPIDKGTEGVFDPMTNSVYLIADNLATPDRANWVAIHEVVGHGGIRKLSNPVAESLDFAGKNGFVKKLAQAIAQDRGETFSAMTHTDEAIAELAAATITGNVDEIMERYGIKVPMGMRSNLMGMLKRVVDAVRQFIGLVTGRPVEVVRDGEVLGLIRRMKDAAEGVDQGYDTAGVSNGVRASMSGFLISDTLRTKATREGLPLFSKRQQSIPGAAQPPAQPPRQNNILRPANKASMEADTSLIDKATSVLFKMVGWNRIFEPALDRLLERAGEFVPEKIKAGMVSDYGLGADYIDRKAEMKAAEAAQNRKSAGLVEMLATLTRAESRVAYQWMQEKPDTAREKALLENLPSDSRETLARLKKMISDMGAEAVRLGQMSQDAYQRNNMAYLHRTYAKHVMEPQGAVSRMMRARALKIKGNQYKGRGIFDKVRMNAVGGSEEFGRKLQQGQADKSLVGEKLIRFERRDDSADAMDALPGMTKKPMGKLKEVVYWPVSETIPAKFGDWVNAGTFEVRDTKGDKLVVWRDFTKDERERMGELDEVRYAVAQTLQMMTHDIEVGRFFAWTAKTYGKVKSEGKETVASESMLRSYGRDEWVQVPSAVIPGTQTKKYGALAGLYIPGAVWNDIRQTAGTRIEPFGHAHEMALQFWKKSKTAWSPAVHMNNVMANFVIADWHDLRAADLAEALKVWSNNRKDGYREIYQRFEDSGALGGMFLSNEALRDEIAKQLESIKAELTGEQEAKNEMTRMAKVMHLVTMAGMVPVKGAKLYTSKMEDAYQFEDAIFRLAAFVKAIRYGKSDIEAGRIARNSFLNYDINAPWIQAARHTMLPFVSFFYRALPMALNTVKSKPWKVVKLMAFWHLVSMVGYMMSGGDEDDERKMLPKEKQGSVWGVVPKMVRMPWNHADDAPYFLDIRRWVPVGDVADMEMGAGMLPPWATPGGPLIMLAEMLVANKSFFTEKEIVLDTDTQGEKLEKRLDHLFKGMLPNVPLPNPLNLQTPVGEINPIGLSQGSGQSYAWSGIEKSMLKREGTIGEVRNTPAAIAGAFGVKTSAYPAGNMQAAQQIEFRKKVEEIQDAMNKIQRNFNNLEAPTVAEQARYERDLDRQSGKLQELNDAR